MMFYLRSQQHLTLSSLRSRNAECHEPRGRRTKSRSRCEQYYSTAATWRAEAGRERATSAPEHFHRLIPCCTNFLFFLSRCFIEDDVKSGEREPKTCCTSFLYILLLIILCFCFWVCKSNQIASSSGSTAYPFVCMWGGFFFFFFSARSLSLTRHTMVHN